MNQTLPTATTVRFNPVFSMAGVEGVSGSAGVTAR